jgi:DNA recombination protein RmuC
MSETVLVVAGRPFALSELLLAAAIAAAVLLVVVVALAQRARRHREDVEAEAAVAARDTERRLAEMLRLQAEMTGRMQTMAEVFSTRQADLAHKLGERIEGMSHRLGLSFTETTKNTHEHLTRLNERIGIIDRAQATITELSGQVVSLQAILSNKQSRGAFGQGRMEAIVADGLPHGGYDFQATLSNGNRPDCLVHFPNGAASLVIDAKFPLEGHQRLRTATTPEEVKQAETLLRRDIGTHITAIRDRYFLPGETQDTAFLFVPSESIFAELHERFPDLIDRAARVRVVIVSPSLLLLSIQVVQAILRDAKMKEQAHIVQREVAQLMDDLGRLSERIDNLHKHFGQANRDIEQIMISSDKLGKRGQRIADLDFGEEAPVLARAAE